MCYIYMSIYYIFVYLDIIEYVYIDTVWYAVKTYGLRWIKITSRSAKVTHCEVMPSELMKIGHQNAIRNIMKYPIFFSVPWPDQLGGFLLQVSPIMGHNQKKHGTTGPVTMASLDMSRPAASKINCCRCSAAQRACTWGFHGLSHGSLDYPSINKSLDNPWVIGIIHL